MFEKNNNRKQFYLIIKSYVLWFVKREEETVYVMTKNFHFVFIFFCHGWKMAHSAGEES